MAASRVKEAPDYSGLLKATITFDYLHTNSTTHEFVFGAIAEIVDNARDAGAKNLHVDYDESTGLSFLDDGCGMLPEEAVKIIAFGHSHKRYDTGMIGRYGNGLKSGALRLGKDFMVFTKRAGFMTALMLSRSFHQEKGIQDVLVPAPQFNVDYEHITTDAKKHAMEMSLIYEYSPFKNEKDFFGQFKRIRGESGTLVVLYNLRRIETGQFEMDFETDSSDIGLTDVLPEREPERNSLRSYLSVLYLNPYTKIHLRGRKVNTIRILSTLGDAYTYTKDCNFKGANEKMTKEIQQEILKAEEDLKQRKSAYGALKASRSSNVEELDSKTSHLAHSAQDAKERVDKLKNREKELLKQKNKPFAVEFSFGMNVHHRNRYGCMVYNNGRLIDMYVKLPVQKECNDLYMKCLGVVGVVDLPYEVLEPTHNKQSFESKRDYKQVMRAFNDCMEHFWETRICLTIRGPEAIKRYWANFGYEHSSWSSECSQEVRFKHRRFVKTNHVVQCDNCLKWRLIEYKQDYVLDGVPENWCCSDHPDPSKRKCDLPEHLGKLNPAKDGLKIKKPTPHASSSLHKPQHHREETPPPPPSPLRPVISPNCPVAVRKRRSQQKSLEDSDDEVLGKRSQGRMQRRNKRDRSDSEDSDQEEADGVKLRKKKHNVPLDSDEDFEPMNCSSDRRSSTSKTMTKGNVAKKSEMKQFKSPPRHLLSDVEEDEVSQTAPVQKARTKADFRNQLGQNTVSSDVAQIAVKTTHSADDLEVQRSNKQLAKKVAELEAQLKKAEDESRKLKKREASFQAMKGQIVQLKKELADAKKWKQALVAFMTHLGDLTNTPDLIDLVQYAENGPLGEVNWKTIVQNITKSIQKTSILSSYPNLLLDIVALLNWVSSNQNHEFTEEVNEANCVRIFKDDLCDRIRESEDT